MAIGIFVVGILVAATFGLVQWIVRPRINPHANSCVANLKSIDGTKEIWALVYKKARTDVPSWDDLVGKDISGDVYLKRMPVCGAGGVYKINSVGEPPTCSLGTNVTPPHVLPQ